MKRFISLPNIGIEEIHWKDLSYEEKSSYRSTLNDHIDYLKESKGMLNFHVLVCKEGESLYVDTIVKVECAGLVEADVSGHVVVFPFIEGEIALRPLTGDHEISKVALYSNTIGRIGFDMDQFVTWKKEVEAACSWDASWREGVAIQLDVPTIRLLSYWTPTQGLNSF